MDEDFFEQLRSVGRFLRRRVGEAIPRSRPPRPVPTIEEAQAAPGKPLPAAVLDSITQALGTEAPVISTSIGLSNAGGGFFDPGPEAVVVNPVSVENAALAKPKIVQHLRFVEPGPGKTPEQVRERMGEVLAHELAHAATVDDRGHFRPGSLGGFTARFMDRFSALPESTQKKHFAAYAPGITYLGTEDQKQEIVAKTLERGFALARVADPNDPQKLAALVNQVEQEFPGTREAYNFWIRRLRDGAPGPRIPVPEPRVEAADAAPPAPQRPSGPPTPGRLARRFSPR